MEHSILLIASASVLCFGLDNSPIRHTIYGKVRGKVTSRYDGVEVEEYLGVPFAEPPEGELRFKVSYFLTICTIIVFLVVLSIEVKI